MHHPVGQVAMHHVKWSLCAEILPVLSAVSMSMQPEDGRLIDKASNALCICGPSHCILHRHIKKYCSQATAMVRYFEYPSPTITTDNHIRKSVKKFIINHVRKTFPLDIKMCLVCIVLSCLYVYLRCCCCCCCCCFFLPSSVTKM